MSKKENVPRPNDTDADYEERVEKTIRNMEAAEFAAEFADGNERAAIKAKNKRREDALRGTHTKPDKK